MEVFFDWVLEIIFSDIVKTCLIAASFTGGYILGRIFESHDPTVKRYFIISNLPEPIGPYSKDDAYEIADAINKARELYR